MKKFDYISILAGGSCKFNCEFCIGKNIRKDASPHFSKKVKSFIECFSDLTDLISVSGDTSDPSFIKETWKIPNWVKEFNPKSKVTLHTRNIDCLENALNSGYDKFVFSIDENFTREMLKKLEPYKDKVRLSFVMTVANFWVIDAWKEKIPEIFEFQMTIRPEVKEAKIESNLHTFINQFLNILGNTITLFELHDRAFVNEKGALVLEEKPNIWFWNYNKTNKMMDVRYLFSDGKISSNCEWEKI